ncbi:hypothetical protein HPB47_011687 [Ixodes persulcatus]|uniref:Uncharacterized protein n=1 Tax=Ixodes persulcatus TaxID=34615 RepID=A0AC60NVR1_IXOPE|nr:hypothetical protein HPB47_011687 [Ixodes persulcatus]
MSLWKDYRTRLATRTGERLLSGYEMYRLSLLKHLGETEYADASSDDLSSDWDEPEEMRNKAKKIPAKSSSLVKTCTSESRRKGKTDADDVASRRRGKGADDAQIGGLLLPLTFSSHTSNTSYIRTSHDSRRSGLKTSEI